MADNYLITGYWGESHITPENDRGINAAIFGKGRYVLPVGEQFRAEYIGNNTIRMYDGKLINNGAAAGIPAGEYIDLPIANAGQGKKRNDFIAFQYAKDGATLKESGQFVVLQGTETSGTASDPILKQQDLLSNEATLDQYALYRVSVSGTAIAAPVKVFTVRTIAKMSDVEAASQQRQQEIQAVDAKVTNTNKNLQNEQRVIYNLTWDTSTNKITNGNTVAAQLYADITGGRNVEIRLNSGTISKQIAFAIDRKSGLFSAYMSHQKMIYTWQCKENSIDFWNKTDLTETIVEQGTSENWHYRKWASGVIECWGSVQADYFNTINTLVIAKLKIPSDVSAVESVTATSKDILLKVSYALTDVATDHSITIGLEAMTEDTAKTFTAGSKININVHLFGS